MHYRILKNVYSVIDANHKNITKYDWIFLWYDKLKPITDLIRGAEAKLSH